MTSPIRIAVVSEAGIVANVIKAPFDFSLPGTVLVPSESAKIGDRYDAESGQFSTPPPPALTQGQIIAAVQAWLDEQAKAKGYDGILSAASYATSTNPKFGPEGIAARDGRDATWAYCYEQLDAIQGGSREPPASIDEFLSELTPVAWP